MPRGKKAGSSPLERLKGFAAVIGGIAEVLEDNLADQESAEMALALARGILASRSSGSERPALSQEEFEGAKMLLARASSSSKGGDAEEQILELARKREVVRSSDVVDLLECTACCGRSGAGSSS